jgi:hypothetical protein
MIRRGNTLITRYTDKINGLKERLEETVQEYEEVITDLIKENELVRNELNEEKLTNNFVNQYMYTPENTSMEIMEL